MTSTERLVIVDYGSQYTQLIARRIRELGVYSDIQSWAALSLDKTVKGIVLSGGPASVYDANAPTLDERIMQHNVPILGICYGMQLLVQHFGGTVKPGRKEYGQQVVTALPHMLFAQNTFTAWMSHGDSAVSLGNMVPIASSASGIAAVMHPTKPVYGVQFHPEVTHTVGGKQLLQSFLGMCNCNGSWSLDHYIQQVTGDIKQAVGSAQVMALVSGGVDSTVSLMLCSKALLPEQIYALHVDTGLLRHDESKLVVHALSSAGIPVDTVDASSLFYDALRGVTQPEEKRKRIGDVFVDIAEKKMDERGLHPRNSYLCQGTLYTDLIESGKGHAALIKSHHNVNSPRIKEWRDQGRLIEPNKELFKDEVRAVGRLLGLPEALVARQPFPGPGLAIRIIGDVTPEKVSLLQKIDALVVQELDAAAVPYWQAFPVLLPVKTVGVKGDGHSYEHVVAIRVVDSIDGMTADWMKIPYGVLQKISSRLTNEIADVNRVVYDITSKPPATIEWE